MFAIVQNHSGRPARLIFASLAVALLAPAAFGDPPLPFTQRVETYRDRDGDIVCFALRLEQPFLGEAFEQSNYLRVTPLDHNAALIYPRETRFTQRQAAFYGRLRGAGQAKLQLEYETVAEDPDGSRRINVSRGELVIDIPSRAGGSDAIYREWARQQNQHFLRLLRYDPRDSFLQYAILQSKALHDVEPPALPSAALADSGQVERDLYSMLSGALAIQESLQLQTLRGVAPAAGGDVHISNVPRIDLRSPPYEDLLGKRLEEGAPPPQLHELARLVPADQYLLHVRTLPVATELLDLTLDWGGSLLRLLTIRGQDTHDLEVLGRQLCISRGELESLSAAGAIGEVAVTGNDLQFSDGTDITLLIRVTRPADFDAAAQRWLADAQAANPGMEVRDYHHAGYNIAARFTADRAVSSFAVRVGDVAVLSNSHVGLRRILDVARGQTPSLHAAPDYAYVLSLLPPAEGPHTGYVYVSDACIRRLISPRAKIAERRRRQCFNHLVMLNNASMLFRMEQGRSPQNLSELVAARYIDERPLICPHGGAYAFDPEDDAALCSLHNRLKRLTPSCELELLTVSGAEVAEYGRFRDRYQEFWSGVFDPIAVRIAAQPSVKLEVCILPLANGSLYTDLRAYLAADPLPPDGAHTPRHTLASISATPGRPNIAAVLKSLPGIADVLASDPTLTDLAWLGDRASLHVCDGDSIVEVDPSQIRPLNLFGEIHVSQQAPIVAAIAATNLPVYFCVDLSDEERARRFLDLLSSRIVLQTGAVLTLPTSYDAYRLPDYQGHARYVIAYQLYALKVRLHVAIVGSRLIAATREDTLRQVLDADQALTADGALLARPNGAGAPPTGASPTAAQPGAAPAALATDAAHMHMAVNLASWDACKEDLRLAWAERARRACHANLTSIYELLSFYDAPPERIDSLSLAKYGVSYVCPEGGDYRITPSGEAAGCSVHGTRRNPRQPAALGKATAFMSFFDSLDRIVLSLRFSDDALFATVDIQRRPVPPAGQ